jgi:enoyl-CoA hydratase/carnithine racemase
MRKARRWELRCCEWKSKLMLEVSREGRVLRLTLNRPEKRNALNGALCRELVAAIEQGDSDTGVGAILISGAGASFCAGMDLSEMLTPQASALADIHERLFTIGRRVTVPIIAAVHGAALAGGTGLAANAHIVVAAEDATFGLTEIRIGLWPFVIYRAVVDAVGERRALELGITGRIFSASEAAGMGLAHYVAPTSELMGRAGEIASAAAAASPMAMRTGLRFVAETRGLDSEKSGQTARRFREELFQTADFAEGIRAFREKRPPKWS